MTKCMRKQVNLKSSVYNQTGQNYFEQLAAYNSMNAHLRRILLAKNVVDTSNKTCLKKNQCKVQGGDDNRIYLRLERTNNVIDKLAYDTQHHPMDILRINLNARHPDCYNYNLDRVRVCNNQMSYEDIDEMDYPQQSGSKNKKSPTTARSPKRKKLSSNFCCKREEKSTRQISQVVGPSTFSRQRYEKEFSVPCPAARLDAAISQSPRQKLTDGHCSLSSSFECFDYDKKSTEELIYKRLSSQKEEEKKYVKFIYDITKEIMQRGLYTDKELQDVFKKHVNQHKGILNTNKMLYEIYQLKISLNIPDDSDTDEELEDLIHTQKLLSVSEIRPPTPPKVLDENKVMEKLESYQKMITDKKVPRNDKAVMLVDANPEIIVTERDVLTSLIEAGVDPKQVQYICKKLRYKSKDVSSIETTREMDTETTNFPDLKMENLKLEHDDKTASIEAETAESARDTSVADYSAESFEQQETNSSTSNLISTQDEMVEIKEETESEITSKDKTES
ncbi:hypothetical protein PUN28_013872 [Cardiocondyla obscurior]|uniref:Spermatogenesis-associated protein 7 like protein n=1 Tax=Cardiocondyla obscurior TaxID=286306 RepID=A0AAW2F750_9HYME